jgi:ribosomal protein L7/L12
MPNKIVGMISIDIDQDRAARSMGIRQKDKPDFFDAITNFEPGTFFVRGPAFAVQKAKIAVGKTLTTHLDPGEVASRHKPPTPGAIKRILSELKDLPDEAEEEVATVEGFKKKIRELEGALREAKHATPVVKETAPEKIKVPMIRKGELARLARMTKKLVKAEAALTSVLGSSLDGLRGAGDQLSQRQQVVVSMLGNLQVALQGTPTKIQTNTTYGKLDKTGAPSEHELKLIANGHVILAIKSYRERTGASLLDAKNVMDIARDPSKTAYFGGKVERFKKNGNSVHAADIASAYPKELTSPPPAKEGSIKALGWKLFGVIASVYPRSMKSRTACTLVGVSRRSSAVDLQLAALRKTALIQSRDGENELTSTGLGLAKARKLIGITHKSPIEALEDCLGRLKKKAARDILQVVAFAGEAGITRAAIIEKLGRSNKSSDVDLAFSQLKGVGWVSKEDDRFVAAKEIRPS